MGLRSPKSLVEAREGHSFLDIIIGQTLALRKRYGVRLPLILMNSQATREETMRALEAHPELDVGTALDFLQSMVPKLDAEQLEPISWPSAPSLEWNPPGHGDVYPALRGSGMLDTLLEQGYRYAMISNADNLGATTEARIPAHMEQNEIPFLMEVVHRHRGRPQGRAHRTPALRRAARAARDGADSARGRGVVPRLPALALLQHQHAVVRPARAE